MTNAGVIVALGVSTAAVLVWGLVLVRSVAAYVRADEHRPLWLVMPIAGIIAAVGTLASAVGFAVQRGVIVLDISPDVLTLIASMGRGALLAAGIIALGYYRPPRTHP